MVPRRPHTGTIFGGTRIKLRSVWIRTSGAWGQPSAVHADRTTTKSALLDTDHEDQPVLPNVSRNRAYFHPHPHTPDPPSPTRWLQQSLARSVEVRQQVGDTEDVAVSSQCTVAEHRTLLLSVLIHLCSLPPNCRVLASTASTTLKASKTNLESYWELLQKPFKKPKPITFFVPFRLNKKIHS